jgi:cell division initiation protein
VLKPRIGSDQRKVRNFVSRAQAQTGSGGRGDALPFEGAGVPSLSASDVFTPDDIANAKLRRALVGGYKASETRQYLHQIAWELSNVLHERGTFEEEARRFRAQLLRYERREELESASLSGAHAAAREIREEARRDAELVLKKAYKHASEVRATAEKEASSRVAEFKSLEEKSRIMRTELRGLLASVLEALSEPAGAAPKQEERPVLDDLREAVKAAATQSVSELNPELTGRSDGQPADEEPALPGEDQDEWSGDERVA